MNNRIITAFVSSTYFEFNFKECDFRLREYIKDFIKRKLLDYEKNIKNNKFKIRYGYFNYNVETGIMRMPVNYIKVFEKEIRMSGFGFRIKYKQLIKGREIKIKLKKGIKDKEHQVEPIKFLSQVDDTWYRKGLDLKTGQGKTYCTIKTICNLKLAAMIVTSGLIDQWYKSIFKFTTLKEDDVYILKEFNSVKKLIDMVDSGKKLPSILLCSLETLRPYVAKKDNYISLKYDYEKLIDKLQIGIKIFDEVHLNFHAFTQIDLFSNIRYNIYLTATFDATKKDTKVIFDTIYPIQFRYGKAEVVKYIDVYIYRYISRVHPKYVVRKRGYMHSKFEQFILKRKYRIEDFINTVLIPVINMHFVNIKNNDEKMLIYFSTVDMIQTVKMYLDKTFKDELKISTYIASDSDDVVLKNDLLLTTPKKSGVGTDIPNLRTVLNTISFENRIQTEQMIGRLRDLKNGNTTVFVDIYDPTLYQHNRHMFYRKQVYKSIAKNISENSLIGNI